jgi:hypothetical protein
MIGAMEGLSPARAGEECMLGERRAPYSNHLLWETRVGGYHVLFHFENVVNQVCLLNSRLS